jgi:hypothetical protein
VPLRVFRLALGLGIVAPFVPAVIGFLHSGIPDVLFSGDAAALELATLHAAKSVQYLGPYSRFGWSHPGPLFFYLAMPLYDALGQRGPALNLFALISNLAASVAIVFTAARVGGRILALTLVGLLAVFDLIGAPYLLTNEWNPIWPMLWLALFTLLAARLALGVRSVLPAMAFVGSLIVQTHIGYALEVVAIGAFAAIRGGIVRGARDSRTSIAAAAAILLVCWSLPLIEAATTTPGNLQQLATFFAPTPRHLSQQPWTIAFTNVAEQLATAPWALFEAVTQRDLAMPGTTAALLLAGAQVVGLALAMSRAAVRGDAGLGRLGEVVLLQVLVAVMSVRGIRGEVAFYLVAWCSVIGLLGLAATITTIVVEADRSRGRSPVIPTLGALAITALALSAPIARAPVFTPPAPEASSIALAVADFVHAHPGGVPVVSVATRDRWPIAVAAVLHLHKQNIPVRVDREWLTVVGRQFAAPPGPHGRLVFGDAAFAARASQSGMVAVATAGDASVFYAPAGANRQSND